MSRTTFARKFFITVGLGLTATTCLAQPAPNLGRSSSNPYANWFNSLTAADQQRVIAALPTQLARDMATPEAWRSSTQVCTSFGPIETCQSLDGNGFSVGLVEGMRVSADRDNAGWHFGVTANGELPLAAAAGVAGSVSYYPGTGNVQVCEGAYVGIPSAATGSLQECQTLDRQRAADIQAARAQIASQPAMPASYQLPAAANTVSEIDTETLRAVEAELRRRVGANTYNPPAEFVAPTLPASSGQAATRPVTSSDQFQAEVRRQMERFQAEAARQETVYRNQPAVSSAATVGSSAPSSNPAIVANSTVPSQRITYDEYAPRNGYDAYGNRADSTRRQYDAQGYYTNPAADARQQSSQVPAPQAVRQNRAYSTDGTSRPIGRNFDAMQQYQAIQQWSQQQIARQQAGGTSNSSNNSNGSSVTAQSASRQLTRAQSPSASSSNSSVSAQSINSSTGSARAGNQLVCDENAPRNSNGSSNPAVAARRNGTQSNTANLGPAISARRTGTESQTASLQFPH